MGVYPLFLLFPKEFLMPKKPIDTTFKQIEVGKFYFVHDGSRTGHPALIVYKDDQKNLYLAIKFDSDKPGEVSKKSKGIRHITKLKHPISKDIVASYVKNRPILCKRKDIWAKELTDLSVNEEDKQLLALIARREPTKAPSLRKKEKK